MRILITGSRGNFPTALIQRLSATGYDLTLFDIEPMESGDHQCVQGDIRDAGAVTAAMRECDAVIHAAAYHDDMVERRNYDDYYGVNVTGTHNILLAMHRLGVKYMVMSSSEAVYGNGAKGHRVLEENVPCIPTSAEGMTKLLCEEMCRFYARQHGMNIAVLRYGHFLPVDWKVAGMGRLTNWLDRDDVAQANECALGVVVAEEFEYRTFQIYCEKPFVDSDWPELAENPGPIIESYWPGSTELLARYGLRVPRIHTRYDIRRAQETMGFEPQFNFDQFVARLRRESTRQGTGGR